MGKLRNYVFGRLLSARNDKPVRRYLLWAAVVYNSGLLVIFKYLNFFIGSFVSAFTFFGLNISGSSLNSVMPVGVSFLSPHAKIIRPYVQ